MPLKYNKVLVIGATSGIGLAYAERVISDGKKAIVVGRRQDRLEAFVAEHGEDKAEAITFDITKLDQIQKFADDIAARHPDLDSIILNSGIQRGFDFTKPETIDPSVLALEMNTNYISLVYLTHAFLPHLQRQNNETSLIYTSSGLALVPMVVKRLNYSASKAALHHFILALREQLKDGPGNIKVIEIFPPAVQTELHDEKHQPDIKDGRSMGMPLKEFTDESWSRLVKGEEQIAVGFVETAFDAFEKTRQGMFHQMLARIKENEQKGPKSGS
ncbi:short-chain dehydrogenase/ reductase-like protein [Aaosphaeria arxii CBS 175.79]|uniref:Short-chain dehydrogenase/ reductase-like protein n=1 Tax=Aaosphaeria arxii CBS 175.79 TaxID=1450172 RepID=A0A6A5Y6U3_9PLEO|nr:short-chain dehydrogenase/ reductase-like protein [Aaosphaeria arxii CBS 175.79]KAF2020943.1 short-chain dehydrogenase/ reductase-like protein [Aaosphaeria arxii CBS 175.79]